jgi:acetylornithine deacetylase
MSTAHNVTINPERTISLLRHMVQIDSVNPSLVPGAKGEMELAQYIARILADGRIEVELTEIAPGRPNLIARLRGVGAGRTLILNGHLDTVSVAGMKDPFSATIQDGKMFGRGTLDMKGGLAAGMSAMLALHEAAVPLAGDLVLACVADEEYASIGTEAMAKEITGDGCIVLEPTGPRSAAPGLSRVTVAHGGFVWAEIETEGIAAHGSMPSRGVDAIVKMGHILTEVADLSRRLPREKSFVPPLAQEVTMRPSVHASLIEGGRELSSYPDRCLLTIERRLIPGEAVEDVEAELGNILKEAGAGDPDFKAQQRITFAREPWQASDGDLLSILDQAFTRETGHALERTTMAGWTDASITEDAGIPTLIFGPAGDGAHALVEFVNIESVLTCARVLTQTAMVFCE